jgi:PIN domain nuclease of toxin-antitoxin system
VPARESAAVTDTHALLFHAAGGRRLGPRARAVFAAAEEREAIIYVPVAVVWEVTLLVRAVRVNLHRPVRDFFGDLFSNPSYQPHPLDPAQVFDAGELRALRDPFDAIICAAALDLHLPLISRDEAIAESDSVRLIW